MFRIMVASQVLFLAGMAGSILAAGLGVVAAFRVPVPFTTALAAEGAGSQGVSLAGSRGQLAFPYAPARITGWLTTAILGSAVVARVIEAQRPPYANLWEYFLVLAFGISLLQSVLAWRTHEPRLGVVAWPLVAALLLIANHWFDSRVEPLIPALQNNRLLAIHVASMLTAYSAMGVAFAAAVVYLLQAHRRERTWLPSAATAEEIEHVAILIGFPIMGIGIALGAYWGNIAWGRYWGWDPKETTALVAWLVYAGYMHARNLAGWRGDRVAWIAVAGFGVIVFNIFVVNFVISGLHSYAGA